MEGYYSMDGKFQNNIEDLPVLELYRYENIFKVFETGDKNFYFYNINKKISLPDDLNTTFFDYVTLDKKIPLTTLSYRLYGTTYLWWLILVINKIDNPVRDLPVGKKLKYIKNEYIKDVLDNIKNQLQ